MAFVLEALDEDYNVVSRLDVWARDLGEAYYKAEKIWNDLGIEPYDIAVA